MPDRPDLEEISSKVARELIVTTMSSASIEEQSAIAIGALYAYLTIGVSQFHDGKTSGEQIIDVVSEALSRAVAQLLPQAMASIGVPRVGEVRRD